MAPDAFVNGGWWHDASILAATGEGLEKEEPKGWKGWWNEQIVRWNVHIYDGILTLLGQPGTTLYAAKGRAHCSPHWAVGERFRGPYQTDREEQETRFPHDLPETNNGTHWPEVYRNDEV